MSQIILDFGSGNTCKNDIDYAKRMIDELKAVDTGKHEVIIKWQLFEKAGDNVPLDHNVFYYAYKYAKELGYKTTSSVFDKESLDFLVLHNTDYPDIPFVKIANNRNLDWLIGEVPRKIPVYVSVGNTNDWDSVHCEAFYYKAKPLFCVSDYPAKKEIYEIHGTWLKCGISDHTTNWDLFKRYEPSIYECHYKLDDSTGLDAGEFARTPEMLKKIL